MSENLKLIDQQEVAHLLKHGSFMDMDLAELQKEHAELIAFNTVLERKQRFDQKRAKKYARKVQVIADLMHNPVDQATTLKAIQNVINMVAEA